MTSAREACGRHRAHTEGRSLRCQDLGPRCGRARRLPPRLSTVSNALRRPSWPPRALPPRGARWHLRRAYVLRHRGQMCRRGLPVRSIPPAHSVPVSHSLQMVTQALIQDRRLGLATAPVRADHGGWSHRCQAPLGVPGWALRRRRALRGGWPRGWAEGGRCAPDTDLGCPAVAPQACGRAGHVASLSRTGGLSRHLASPRARDAHICVIVGRRGTPTGT
jgi:hypothetical protein